jgi:hypothetical protein
MEQAARPLPLNDKLESLLALGSGVGPDDVSTFSSTF